MLLLLPLLLGGDDIAVDACLLLFAPTSLLMPLPLMPLMPLMLIAPLLLMI
jgi:hypothetical protein